MGVAGMTINSDYGSFPHSLLSTNKIMNTDLQPRGFLFFKVVSNEATKLCHLGQHLAGMLRWYIT